jgi:hypothetical protein
MDRPLALSTTGPLVDAAFSRMPSEIVLQRAGIRYAGPTVAASNRPSHRETPWPPGVAGEYSTDEVMDDTPEARCHDYVPVR